MWYCKFEKSHIIDKIKAKRLQQIVHVEITKISKEFKQVLKEISTRNTTGSLTILLYGQHRKGFIYIRYSKLDY